VSLVKVIRRFDTDSFGINKQISCQFPYLPIVLKRNEYGQFLLRFSSDLFSKCLPIKILKIFPLSAYRSLEKFSVVTTGVTHAISLARVCLYNLLYTVPQPHGTSSGQTRTRYNSSHL